jgi:hypothetical protein
VTASDTIDRLVGELLSSATATLKPADIPLSTACTPEQLAALKAGDDDPLEVVIEVAPGQSSRGWTYSPEALQKLVEHVRSHTLNGILGHQREEDLAHQFPSPVTHWIGSEWRDGKAYFRGVVDKTAADLKRWIRAGRVTQPSIFTRPTLRGRVVTDVEPLSIDWAPLDRAGMSTARVVAWGETAHTSTTGDTDMDLAQLAQRIGLPASATEAEVLDRIGGLYQRAQTSLLADARLAAGRHRVQGEYQAFVAKLAVGSLDPCATPADIDRAIGEIVRSDEYRALGGPGRSLNPAAPRAPQSSGADMSIFGTNVQRIEPF